MYFLFHFIWYICFIIALKATIVTHLRFMTLGEKIKIYRLKKKFSQQDLGELAETHQKNISKYEQDLVIPSAVTLKKIADAIEVSTDFLLGGQDSNSIKDTSLLKYFKEIDNMPDNTKQALLKVIDAYVRDYKTQKAYSS